MMQPHQIPCRLCHMTPYRQHPIWRFANIDNSGLLPSPVVSENLTNLLSLFTVQLVRVRFWWTWDMHKLPRQGTFTSPLPPSSLCCEFCYQVMKSLLDIEITMANPSNLLAVFIGLKINVLRCSIERGCSHYKIVNYDLVAPKSDNRIVRSHNRTW